MPEGNSTDSKHAQAPSPRIDSSYQGGSRAPRDAFVHLVPIFLGLSTCRIGTMVSHVYGISGHSITWRGSLIMVATLFVLLIAALLNRRILDERLVSRLAIGCCAIQICLTCAIGIASGQNLIGYSLSEALTIANEVVSLVLMFYWLRALSQHPLASGAIVVFLSTATGELLTFLCTLASSSVITLALAVFLCGMQFEWIHLNKYHSATCWSRDKDAPSPKPAQARPMSFVTHARASRRDANRLSTTTLMRIILGLSLLAFFIGFICGYPDGTPISIPDDRRLAYVACAALPCILVAAFMLFSPRIRIILPTEILVAAFGILAIITYTAFPYELARGAVFANATTAIMVGCVRYCIVYLMKIGSKDPFSYAVIAWCLWTGLKAAANIVAGALYPAQIDLPIYSMGLLALLALALIVVPNSVPSAQKPHVTAGSEDEAPIPSFETEPEADYPFESEAAPSPLRSAPESITDLLGLDETGGLSQSRQAAMMSVAKAQLGIYQLSDREIEAAALYALGFTQQRVAEEMNVSRSTAHEFIKRVYAKTNFHSRQDLIDFLSE